MEEAACSTVGVEDAAFAAVVVVDASVETCDGLDGDDGAGERPAEAALPGEEGEFDDGFEPALLGAPLVEEDEELEAGLDEVEDVVPDEAGADEPLGVELLCAVLPELGGVVEEAEMEAGIDDAGGVLPDEAGAEELLGVEPLCAVLPELGGVVDEDELDGAVLPDDTVDDGK